MAHRIILHSDLNNFYASVECIKNPSLKDLPIAVVGDREDRHGIVLAKNAVAKTCGVKTGDVYWLARQKCGDLVEVKADFKSYIEYSAKVRKIYERYTDNVEAFGIDECWLDVTGSVKLFGSGEEIAEAIKKTIKEETGLTVSVGISFNKVFAKLASDTAASDSLFVISEDNYKTVAFEKPVETLLYVGRATERKLKNMNILTIGDLANANLRLLESKLGKWGTYLHYFANGKDETPVMKSGDYSPIKSIGNSITHYKDITDKEEAESVIYLLAESVSQRITDAGLGKASGIGLNVRFATLESVSKRSRLIYPSALTEDIAASAVNLYSELVKADTPVRGLGVFAYGFCGNIEQTAMFNDYKLYKKRENLSYAINKIRRKYGYGAVTRAVIFKNKKLKEIDVKNEHTIHPYSFFKK